MDTHFVPFGKILSIPIEFLAARTFVEWQEMVSRDETRVIITSGEQEHKDVKPGKLISLARI